MMLSFKVKSVWSSHMCVPSCSHLQSHMVTASHLHNIFQNRFLTRISLISFNTSPGFDKAKGYQIFTRKERMTHGNLCAWRVKSRFNFCALERKPFWRSHNHIFTMLSVQMLIPPSGYFFLFLCAGLGSAKLHLEYVTAQL